jgi:chromate transporter
MWSISTIGSLQASFSTQLAFVKGATAAAAGTIAGATIVLTQQAVRDLAAAAIALVSLALLLRFKIKEPILVLLAAVVSLALHTR